MKPDLQHRLVDPAVEIGARLQQYLDKNGLTQEEAAHSYRTKQSWISRILKGQFTERSDIARAMCSDADIPFLDDPCWSGRARHADRVRLLNALQAIGDEELQDARRVAQALEILCDKKTKRLGPRQITPATKKRSARR